MMLSALRQLVDLLKEVLPREEEVKKEVDEEIPEKEKLIERWIKKKENMLFVVILPDGNLGFIQYLPSDGEDRRGYEKEIIENFKELNLIPKQEKGGNPSFYGVRKCIYKSTRKSKDPESLREELKRKFKLSEEKTENIIKIISDKIKLYLEKEKNYKLLIIESPNKEEVKKEVNEETKSIGKGRCMICFKEGELVSSEIICKVFPWLVKKNISPIYSHSLTHYHENVQICRDCIKILQKNKDIYDLETTNLRFFDWRLKIYPLLGEDYLRKIGAEPSGILKFWKEINGKNDLDTLYKEYIKPKIEGSRIQDIFFTFIFFKKDKNKLDILMEEVSLHKFVKLYEIFEEWKKQKDIGLFRNKKSIFSELRAIRKEKGEEKTLLSLFRKLINLQEVDIQELLSLFNRVTREIIFSEDNLKKRMKRLSEISKELVGKVDTINWFQFYNENIKNINNKGEFKL